ncbi:MAG TPA: hypothetical protein EYH07_04920 [Kiloniellaceae bacterium]|nr:hypothetical protein [Kiloniellaceae bacterium]HIP77787.1 hypothetical protein [Kiloniellaceae bacterium]
MEPTETFPARLHVVLARVGDKAVVFRRGPSKRVGTFLWDRRRDTFQLGQWFKGRIYERRSDLSPDGSHMIYFAMNGRRGSWTAVSRTPYLKALDLYAKGDCWEGGGLFTSSGTYWLNDRHFAERDVLRKSSRLLRDESYRPEPSYGAECTGVYYPRLLRDGWRLTERSERGKWNAESIFEKNLPKGWVLRKIAHEQVNAPPGRGCYWDEHELLNPGSQTHLRFPDWEWAEWDGRTLVWAEKGRLFRAALKGDTQVAPAKLLHDFNADRFEAVAAPY